MTGKDRPPAGGLAMASAIKDKLRRGEPSLGSWMSMAHVSIAEILAGAGYDWVVVETEHTAIDVSEVLPLLIAIERRGAIPLVRLAWNDPIQAKAVMDSGAAGVLVPMINSREEAVRAVDAVKYPPLGQRGVGLARAQGYGEDFKEYVRTANDNTLLLVQIEHVDAVANISDIAKVEGIDGFYIGPYDLSLSMGIPGQIDHPDIEAAKKEVVAAALANNLAAGIHLVHPDTAASGVEAAIGDGYTFIALGTDILFLGDSARSLQRAAAAAAAKFKRA
ncbi:MAG: aldolase/citrate lyase family protein [Gemmatimonadota bacterium]|nr:aldolase/citrate lyase family protein [Gemmatimonadota bacterium]